MIVVNHRQRERMPNFLLASHVRRTSVSAHIPRPEPFERPLCQARAHMLTDGTWSLGDPKMRMGDTSGENETPSLIICYHPVPILTSHLRSGLDSALTIHHLPRFPGYALASSDISLTSAHCVYPLRFCNSDT